MSLAVLRGNVPVVQGRLGRGHIINISEVKHVIVETVYCDLLRRFLFVEGTGLSSL